MTKSLNIGSMKWPKESATKGFAYIGKRGSGKSYGASVSAEEFAKLEVPFVVFDPIDVWWGLKVAADGKGKGLPVVVFGIEHADILLDRTMGKRIAQAVVRSNISCVISTFGLSKQAMREVVADFSEELLRINNTPRQVFIEEAHEFVPQRVMGAGARCFSAVEALLVMGRNRGIGVSLLNQRMATLNKDLLTQIDVLVAFRSVGPQDRKAFRDWVEIHNAENDEKFDEFMRSVPGLPTGEAWVWSPEFLEKFERVKFRKRETFHPDRETLGSTFKMPEIKQGDIQSFIDSFAKKPESYHVASSVNGGTCNKCGEKNTRIAGPGKLHVCRTNSPIDKSVLIAEYRRGYSEGEATGFERGKATGLAEARKEIDRLFGIIEHANKILTDIHFDKTKWEHIKMPAAPKGIKSTVLRREIFLPPLQVTSGEVTKPEQKILDAIAWMNAIGVARPNNSVVAFLAGYTNPRSNGYKNPRASLVGNGFVTYPAANQVELTEEGRRLANRAQGPRDEIELHKMVLDRLTGPQQRILSPLLNRGVVIHNTELAALAGYTNDRSNGYKNPRADLRTYGLIEYTPNGVKASDILFL